MKMLTRLLGLSIAFLLATLNLSSRDHDRDCAGRDLSSFARRLSLFSRDPSYFSPDATHYHRD